jgi:hypothetical protein
MNRIQGYLDKGSPRDTPLVLIRDGYVVIRSAWHRQRGGCFGFQLARCDTPMMLLAWVSALAREVWFDREVARELIRAVCNHNRQWWWNHKGGTS